MIGTLDPAGVSAGKVLASVPLVKARTVSGESLTNRDSGALKSGCNCWRNLSYSSKKRRSRQARSIARLVGGTTHGSPECIDPDRLRQAGECTRLTTLRWQIVDIMSFHE